MKPGELIVAAGRLLREDRADPAEAQRVRAALAEYDRGRPHWEGADRAPHAA